MARFSIKGFFPKLLPFFKGILIYFVTFAPKDKPGLITAIFKCLPIVCLMIFVAWHGHQLHQRYTRYWHKIVLGLFFCSLGDYCLVWEEEIWFIFGMLAFGIGHINYIIAFGFKPLKFPIAFVSYVLGALGFLVLFPGLKDVMYFGVPLYTFLLTTMMWRAIARIQMDKWSWTQIMTAIGAVSFVISDLLIGLNLFRKIDIPYFHAAVMSTYYFAQFGIALSVVDIIDLKSD